MKPLSVDIPYPNLDDLTVDVRSGQIISFAYATPSGELTAILQYRYHKLHFADFDESDADTLESISVSEMQHLELLGKVMLKLGVNPLYTTCPNTTKWYSTDCVSRSKLPYSMLADDIMSEMNAISDYKKMLFVLKNEKVEELIGRIILDEELHLSTLKEMIQRYAKV